MTEKEGPDVGRSVPGKAPTPTLALRQEPAQHSQIWKQWPDKVAWEVKGAWFQMLNFSFTDPLALCWRLWIPSQNHGMHGGPTWDATIPHYTLTELANKSCDVKPKGFFNPFCCGRSENQLWSGSMSGCLPQFNRKWNTVIFIDHKATSIPHLSKIFCITQWDARFRLEVVKIPIHKSQVLQILPLDPKQPGLHHSGLRGHGEVLDYGPWGASGEFEAREVGWSCCFRESGFGDHRNRRMRRQLQVRGKAGLEA